MSTAANTIEALRERAPLSPSEILWQDPTLVLRGDGWSIAITTPWRLVRADTLLLGSDHASQSALDEIIAGRAIVGCEAQSARSTIDPALLFDGGIALEIFSVTYLEPWIVVTAGRGHFVASPSD